MVDGEELARKSLCLLPYRVAIEMADRGWIVRNVLVWWKPNALPESVRDRFSTDFEPIFFCTKGPQYYFRQQLQPYSPTTLQRCKSFVENGESFNPAKHKFDPACPSQAPMSLLGRVAPQIAKNLMVPGRATHSMHVHRANGHDREVFDPAGANMRSVWRISTAGYDGAHFAVMPERVVEICIDAGCPPGGSVLDAFLGSGTSGVVAERMRRDFYGIELNPGYARHAIERILAARAKWTAEGEDIRARSPNGSTVAGPTIDGGLVLGEEIVTSREPLP